MLAGPHLFQRRLGPHPRALSLAPSRSLGLKAVARARSAARLRRASLRRATPTRLPRWGLRRLALAAGAQSSPFVLGSMRASRRSFAQATRSARAKALKTA